MPNPFGGRRSYGSPTLAALLLAVSLSAAPVSANPVSGTRYAPPPAGDLLGEWTKFRLREDARAHPLQPDSVYVESLLVSPASPYSALLPTVFPRPGSVFDTQAWIGATARVSVPSAAEATRMLAWDLGMTKALPGFQVPFDRPGVPPWSLAHANLIKAGVRLDIANQVTALLGNDAPAVAANYAVALQRLREKLDRVPADGRASVGLREGVFIRFMLAARADEIEPYDAWYLMKLLQGELSAWRAGGLSVYGYRQLPIALRVARMSASYQETKGFAFGTHPCTAGGTRYRALLLRHHTLCFTDATDRAVHDWYRDQLDIEMRDEAARTSQELHGIVAQRTPGQVRLWEELARMKPLWTGSFDAAVQRGANQAEILEWFAATEYAGADDESVLNLSVDEPGVRYGHEPATDRFMHRATELICRIATP